MNSSRTKPSQGEVHLTDMTIEQYESLKKLISLALLYIPMPIPGENEAPITMAKYLKAVL